jgi:hypothetical protein
MMIAAGANWERLMNATARRGPSEYHVHSTPRHLSQGILAGLLYFLHNRQNTVG